MKTKITPVDSLRMALLKETPSKSDRKDGLLLKDKSTNYDWAGYQKLAGPGVGWFG